MRRKEQEIKDFKVIEDILRGAKVCRMAMSDNNMPYVVPMCFGYKNKTVYLHSSSAGKKINILKVNTNVCLEFESDIVPLPSENACSWNMDYKSVIASGVLSFIVDVEEKRNAFEIIMKQYSSVKYEIPDHVLKKTTVMKVMLEEISGKHSD